jgi:hypothetical protein
LDVATTRPLLGWADEGGNCRALPVLRHGNGTVDTKPNSPDASRALSGNGQRVRGSARRSSRVMARPELTNRRPT